MAYDNTIQAGRSALVRYEFQIPRERERPAHHHGARELSSLAAELSEQCLRHRSSALSRRRTRLPHPRAEYRRRIIPRPAAPGDNPDWMRWNNLGIGFLDQLQYSDAIHAFEQVVKLRPDYADGYINMGLTYIEWEKYSIWRGPPLEKALQLHPDYARALYYLALVERRAGTSGSRSRRSAKGRGTVSTIARRAPRTWHRLLSAARADDAMEQFEALQAIDPDDVAAHYNLAILYRRMGMKEKAAEQAALIRHQANRSRGAHVFARFSPQASGNFDRKRALAHAHRSEAGAADANGPANLSAAVSSSFGVKLRRICFASDRRKFLRSLSRTALVLPFRRYSRPRRSDPAAGAAHTKQKIGPIERSYDAKPAPPPPGPKSPIEGTPLGVSFVDVVKGSGLDVETIYGGVHQEQISFGNHRLRPGLLRL